MGIIEKIKEHRKEVLIGKIPDNLHTCPKCNVDVKNIKLHERTERLFLVIDDHFIKKVWSLLSRWKCRCCKTTFTYYPEFSIPYKRYVKEDIMSLCHKYIEVDKSTYRNVVRHSNLSIGYENNKDRIDERQFVSTTPWRWLSFIGPLEETLSKALSLIRQKSSTSEIFRQVQPLNPRKYRSNERKKLLYRCMRLFYADDEFKNLFGFSIFPQLATRCCWV